MGKIHSRKIMRVLSGIQPSGKLHLGNYFGMMKPAIEMQEEHEVFLFIAEYHALTSTQEPDALRTYSRDVVLDLLACGLNPEQSVLYRQSDVPEVLELSWLLSTVTPMGLLERSHSYKDKTSKGIVASHALFSYPVLMAADILGVNAERVPVGKDQKQHLEITRDIAKKFNNHFGEVFKIPEPMIQEEVAVVPGIDGQKMSKSYNNTIEIFSSESKAKKAIMKIVTDSKGLREPKDPEHCTIFALYRLLATAEQQESLAERYRMGGFGYGDAKKELLAVFNERFEPFRKEREELANHIEDVDALLRQGAERAKKEIGKMLSSVRKAVGLE